MLRSCWSWSRIADRAETMAFGDETLLEARRKQDDDIDGA